MAHTQIITTNEDLTSQQDRGLQNFVLTNPEIRYSFRRCHFQMVLATPARSEARLQHRVLKTLPGNRISRQHF